MAILELLQKVKATLNVSQCFTVWVKGLKMGTTYNGNFGNKKLQYIVYDSKINSLILNINTYSPCCVHITFLIASLGRKF